MEVAGIFKVPHPDLIEMVSYSSINPFFRTTKFRELLMLYREEGCYAECPIDPPTPGQIRYARARLRIWKEKMDKGLPIE